MFTIDEEKLVRLVDEFLAPFGCDSAFSADFSFDPEIDRVHFSILVSERADRLYKEYVMSHFNFTPPSIFMMSLLHEVGHAYTLHTFSEEDMQKFHIQKRTIEANLETNDTDENYCAYFDIEMERAATAWAVNYYQSNREICDAFYSLFMAVLRNEYWKINLIE
jgi:hypothetical protein